MPYVDRHYLEEYAGYYATALRHPSPKTTRIHVFKSEFNQEALDDWNRQAASNQVKDVEDKVQPEYLGFIVVRPIPAAPIGRTVLAPYATSGSSQAEQRVLEAATDTKQRVHLCGIELIAKGVPFQQQDEAVGACATTAIWSALGRRPSLQLSRRAGSGLWAVFRMRDAHQARACGAGREGPHGRPGHVVAPSTANWPQVGPEAGDDEMNDARHGQCPFSRGWARWAMRSP